MFVGGRRWRHPRAYLDLFPHYFSRPPLSGLSFARQLCCDELDGVELRNGACISLR